MPLVRIDVVEGRRDPEQLRLLADTAREVVLDVLAAPPRDRHQVGTEHRPGQLICEDTGLGTARTGDPGVPVPGGTRADRSSGARRARSLGGDL